MPPEFPAPREGGSLGFQMSQFLRLSQKKCENSPVVVIHTSPGMYLMDAGLLSEAAESNEGGFLHIWLGVSTHHLQELLGHLAL